MDIFNFFGSILGYLLWFFFILVKNYGLAIILFAVAAKLITFPFSIKQQKTMAATSKLSLKQKELQKKYGNDKMKLQEETQKLYEKEGVNPASGCMTSIVPLLIMMGLFYTVQNPLANALHLTSAAIDKAVSMLKLIPGLGASFNSQYAQIEIVKHFGDLKPHLTMFSGDELSKIEQFSHSFTFFGLNLLDSPADGANVFGTIFRSNLWIIPVLCLVSSLLSQYFMNKMQPGMQQQQGCMKAMFYVLPLFTAWLACTMPAAVGFYWIISTVTGFLQVIVMNIWYSPADLNAKAEAQRIARRELEEAVKKPLPVQQQKQISAKINNQQSGSQKTAQKQKNKNTKTAKKTTDDYMGTKK